MVQVNAFKSPQLKVDLHFCTTCFNAFSSWYFPKNPDNGRDRLSRNRVSLTAPEMNSSISLPMCGFSKGRQVD